MTVKQQIQVVSVALVFLALAGCGGAGEGSSQPFSGSGTSPAPSSPNLKGLEFRSMDLGTPNPPDARNWRTPEYLGQWGLDAISASEAYERGYFGQDVTIAVADDGFDPTHPELAERIRSPHHARNGNDHVFEPGYEGQSGEGHGTFVALVAAGARGNPGGPYGIDISDGRSIPTGNAHGVAPQASIMPIQLSGGGQPRTAIRHAVDNRAHVLNFSIGISKHYYGKYEGREGIWLTVGKPHFRPLLELNLDGTSYWPYQFREAAGSLGNSDTVVVWAAGNEGWNSVNNEVRMCGKNFIGEEGCALGEGHVSAVDFMNNFSWLYDESDPSRSFPFRDMWGDDCGSENCADYNSASAWMIAPLFEPSLLGKWMVVGALDENGSIAHFSNGCGEARNWCLFAPGVNLSFATERSVTLTGTSFSAPMASGALAILKSRLPSMPMEVVQAVLLVSADPLGTRSTNPDKPDSVYGWGRLNLGRAVKMQGSVRLPFSVAGTTSANQGGLLTNARIELSPALAHVGDRLHAVQVAVGGVGDAYYNMPLSGVAIRTGDHPALGYAARELLTPPKLQPGIPPAGYGAFSETGPDGRHMQAIGMEVSAKALGRWRLRYGPCAECRKQTWSEAGLPGSANSMAASPFFDRTGRSLALQMQGDGVRPFVAVGGGQEVSAAPWHQVGFRLRQESGGIVAVAETSRIDEAHTVWGSHFGVLGPTRTGTMQNRLLLSSKMGRIWRGLIGYEHSIADVSSVGGGILSSVSGLRAEGWLVETRGSGVFQRGDQVRFSVHRETGVSGGQARIDHIVASGNSFTDAFYRGRPQSLERKQTIISLHGRPATRYALGYGLPIGVNMQVAVGLEYEQETDNSATSASLRMDF